MTTTFAGLKSQQEVFVVPSMQQFVFVHQTQILPLYVEQNMLWAVLKKEALQTNHVSMSQREE